MKNKILIFLGLVAIVLSDFIVPVNALGLTPSDSSLNNEDYLERNWARVALATEVQTTINDYYNIKDVYNDTYPTYFGGMYISDDASKLIIQIVEKNIPSVDSEEFDTYNKIISMDNAIKIEYVNNSFNELNEINNSVSEYITTDKIHDNIIGGYVDIMNNKVVVEMKDASIKKQENFKSKLSISRKKMNMSAIEYVEAEQPKSYAKTINSGGEIYGRQIDSTHVAVCSMGFRTKYNNQYGYVTAGHCLRNASSVQSGTVLYSNFTNNGYYDYGFVATNSQYTTSNKLEFPSGNIKTLAVVNYCPTIVSNMAVAKSGIKTKYTSGKVTGINQTVTYKENSGNIVIKGLVKTNVKSDEGDSGAPVFVPRTDSEGGSIPLGVLSGGNKGVLGIGRTMYFTSINDMKAEIQSGRY